MILWLLVKMLEIKCVAVVGTSMAGAPPSDKAKNIAALSKLVQVLRYPHHLRIVDESVKK